MKFIKLAPLNDEKSKGEQKNFKKDLKASSNSCHSSNVVVRHTQTQAISDFLFFNKS